MLTEEYSHTARETFGVFTYYCNVFAEKRSGSQGIRSGLRYREKSPRGRGPILYQEGRRQEANHSRL